MLVYIVGRYIYIYIHVYIYIYIYTYTCTYTRLSGVLVFYMPTHMGVSQVVLEGDSRVLIFDMPSNKVPAASWSRYLGFRVLGFRV